MTDTPTERPMAHLAAEVDHLLVLARGLHDVAKRVHDETVVVNETARLDEELENLT